MQGSKKGRNFFKKKFLSFSFLSKLSFPIRMKESCVFGGGGDVEEEKGKSYR